MAEDDTGNVVDGNGNSKKMPALISPEQAARIQRLEEVLIRIEENKKYREEEKELRFAILTDMTSTKTDRIQVGEKQYAYRMKKCAVNPKRNEVQDRMKQALIHAHNGEISADAAKATVDEIYAPLEVNQVYVLTINNPSKRKAKNGQVSVNEGDEEEDPEDDGENDNDNQELLQQQYEAQQQRAAAASQKRKRGGNGGGASGKRARR